jgi:heme ABC exporter ATP-binding subunit CcmA
VTDTTQQQSAVPEGSPHPVAGGNQSAVPKGSPPVVAGRDTQPAVSLRDVVRHFGRFAALRGITAEFAPGQLYVLLGENGAGKSTLLRVIAGLLAPSRGTVRVLGSEDIRAVATRFGYMGHAPLLYDEMSAIENLEYFSALYGINDRTRCEEAIQTVGLDPTLERRVGQYSQGMRQRISLARAIVHGPELLFLDEPFSNVDVRSAKQMTALLAKMRDAGTTIFVVTHQAALMEPAADECIVLDAGRLIAREKGIPARLLTPYLAEERAGLRRNTPSIEGQP